MASGQIAYAVLSFGGLLSMGDKLFAVPWKALGQQRAQVLRNALPPPHVMSALPLPRNSERATTCVGSYADGCV
jgi:hypothetical protein